MRAFFGFDERYERAEGGMVPDDDFEVIEATSAEESYASLEWALEYRREIVAIYEKHAPEKMDRVDALLVKYQKQLPDLIARLRKKYERAGPSAAAAAARVSEAEPTWALETVGSTWALDLSKAHLLSETFLSQKGNRETVRLLARGMPCPSTYGLPATDGTMWSNFWAAACNNHPTVAVLAARERECGRRQVSIPQASCS